MPVQELSLVKPVKLLRSAYFFTEILLLYVTYTEVYFAVRSCSLCAK